MSTLLTGRNSYTYRSGSDGVAAHPHGDKSCRVHKVAINADLSDIDWSWVLRYNLRNISTSVVSAAAGAATAWCQAATQHNAL